MSISHSPRQPEDPVLLPNPKSLRLAGGTLRASRATPLFRIIDDPAFPNAKVYDIIASEIADFCGGKVHLNPRDDSDFNLVLRLDDSLPNPSPECYRLSITDQIELCARNGSGLLYGIATLRQLLKKGEGGLAEFPKCVIEDYPDIAYRFASRWLIELESSRMAYDWGDGREAMLARYRQKIDFCMRHKINAAFFEGFEWITDKYPEYRDDMRGLNSYARARNVRLVFGGHVIGVGGYPGHTMEGANGLGGLNRHSYPDGTIYDCGRMPGAFDRNHPVTTSDAPHNGTCRSNEALNRLKQADLINYVRKVEPGVLYLHSEDIALYEEFRLMWTHRCADCRRRWPNDELGAADGAAGAVAHGFRWLLEGIASVRNRETGYDGERDCLVIFASPTYGAFYDNDDAWQKVADFWTSISSQLGNPDRVLLCMREQFWSRDGRSRRIPELANRLLTQGGGHGIFTFVVSGADLYTNSALFSSAPRLNHFFEGSKAIFNFNGGLFASAQEIYNSEYTWNLLSPYGIDKAPDYESAKTIYLERSQTMFHMPEDPLLKAALRHCYGNAAKEMEEFYRLRDLNGNFPVAIPFLLCRRLFRTRRVEHHREAQLAQWSGLAKITTRAKRIISQILGKPLPEGVIAKELNYLHGCLTFGERFCAIVAECFRESLNLNDLQARIEELRDFVSRHYPQDFTSPHEGEMNLWVGYLDKLSEFVAADRRTPLEKHEPCG